MRAQLVQFIVLGWVSSGLCGCFGHAQLFGAKGELRLESRAVGAPQCDRETSIELRVTNIGRMSSCFSDQRDVAWSAFNKKERWGYGQGEGSCGVCGSRQSFHCLAPGEEVAIRRSIHLKRRGPQHVLIRWAVDEVTGSPLACTDSRLQLKSEFDVDVTCGSEVFEVPD